MYGPKRVEAFKAGDIHVSYTLATNIDLMLHFVCHSFLKALIDVGCLKMIERATMHVANTVNIQGL